MRCEQGVDERGFERRAKVRLGVVTRLGFELGVAVEQRHHALEISSCGNIEVGAEDFVEAVDDVGQVILGIADLAYAQSAGVVLARLVPAQADVGLALAFDAQLGHGDQTVDGFLDGVFRRQLPTFPKLKDIKKTTCVYLLADV